MKSNAFTRMFKDVEFDTAKPLSDYSPTELVGFVLIEYPNDPVGAVDSLLENLEIGAVLYYPTIAILEGMGHVKKY